jgi:hypothetical protein
MIGHYDYVKFPIEFDMSRLHIRRVVMLSRLKEDFFYSRIPNIELRYILHQRDIITLVGEVEENDK